MGGVESREKTDLVPTRLTPIFLLGTGSGTLRKLDVLGRSQTSFTRSNRGVE
jgi:hypothetical protein